MEETIAPPNICVYPDEAAKTMNIEVELPGMEKENIAFNIYENGFYVVAKKKGLKYMASYALASSVEQDGAVAKYANGLLSVNVPYKKALFDKGVKVEME
jgi:HSP20 family protein